MFALVWWRIYGVVLFVVFTGVIWEHWFQNVFIDFVNDLLKGDFFVTGLFLFAFVTLALLLRLNLNVLLFSFIGVVDERLEFSVDVGQAVAEAFVGNYISSTDWTVLLLFSNDGIMHLASCVVMWVCYFETRELNNSVVLSLFVGALNLAVLVRACHLLVFFFEFLLGLR